MLALSPKTEALLLVIFPDEEERQKAKTRLIEKCGDSVPFCENSSPEEMERIRFSVLKLSEGNLKKLENAILLANTDWRDLLLAAGFGNSIAAYREWYEDKMTQDDFC